MSGQGTKEERKRHTKKKRLCDRPTVHLGSIHTALHLRDTSGRITVVDTACRDSYPELSHPFGWHSTATSKCCNFWTVAWPQNTWDYSISSMCVHLHTHRNNWVIRRVCYPISSMPPLSCSQLSHQTNLLPRKADCECAGEFCTDSDGELHLGEEKWHGPWKYQWHCRMFVC